MDEAEVEYSMLAVTEAFFKFTDFEDYDKVMFNGPFPMNTTTAIQLVGVNTDSPITNSDTEFFLNSTQEFLDQLDDYLGYDMRIRSMNLSTQNTITLNDKHFLFTVVSYYSVHEFKPPMKKIFESKVNKHIESNGNDLVDILTAGDIDYFHDVIEARNALTVSELEDHQIHTMDTNDENSVLKNVLQEVDEEDNEYTNSYTAAVSDLHYVYEEETKVEKPMGGALIYGIVGIFIAIILPTIAFITMQGWRKREVQRSSIIALGEEMRWNSLKSVDGEDFRKELNETV